MADIETTWAVIRRAEELNEAFNQIASPTNTSGIANAKPMFSAIQAELDHKRRFENAMIALAENDTPVAAPTPPAQAKHVKELDPWEVPRDGDPEPAQPWYTPARYFAREFIAEDRSLLKPGKKNLLATKVAKKLTDEGIKPSRKRGGSDVFSDGTVKKAFYGADLSKNNPT